MQWLKDLFKEEPKPNAPALLLLLREPMDFSLDWVLQRVQPAFAESLSDCDLYWGSSLQSSRSVHLKIGGLTVSVFLTIDPEYDSPAERERMPPLEERRSWPVYKQRLDVESYFSMKLTPEQRFSIAAKVATALLTENCVAVYDSFHKQMLPASGETFEALKHMAAAAPATLEPPTDCRRIAITLLLHQPVALDEAAMRAAVERGWQCTFPNDASWHVFPGSNPSVSLDTHSVNFRQTLAPFPPDDPCRKQVLPPEAECAGWPAHEVRLTLFSDPLGEDYATEPRGAVALVALGLLEQPGFLESNCAGVYDSIDHTFWANPADALPALEQLGKRAPRAPGHLRRR
jgi:hypothetical protein